MDWKKYRSIIVYGIGQYYEIVKEELFRCVKPDYLCDRKWDINAPDSYDGIAIIKRENLSQMINCLVIITIGASWTSSSVKNDLEQLPGISIVHINEVIGRVLKVTGKMLKEMRKDGYYQDSQGNQIWFDSTIPNTLSIVFEGKNNILTVGNNVIVGELTIGFGSDGVCTIGDRTEIVEAYFAVSGTKISIGKDCLISTKVLIRNHDGHHIFDMGTHERINSPRDIVIGEQVWIGYRTVILAGARIGKGSVVGACTVTSGQFGEHQIIAGCPARVIREQICWSKDATDYFNHDNLEECISQEALKYL